MRKIAMLIVIAQIALAQRPEFEVASLKEYKIEDPRVDNVPQRSGDRVTMINAELYTMIVYAYHLEAAFELIADRKTPLWKVYYEVQAKAPAGTTEDQLRLMMQSLLEDRFQLKVHRETRDSATYRLLIAKGGSKLHPEAFALQTEVNGRAVTRRPGSCSTWVGREGFHLTGIGATMDQLRRELEVALAAPVTDETGIQGKHTFEALYAMPNWVGLHTYDDVNPPPPLMKAVESDLGLKLEKGTGRIEVLVVDHVEKPTAN